MWTEDRPPTAAVTPVAAAAAGRGPSGMTAGVTADVNDDDEGDDDDEDDVASPAPSAASPASLATPRPDVLPERVAKLKLTAESVVNGTKTETPFVRRQGGDVWNVSFKIEVQPAPLQTEAGWRETSRGC